jgi:hypothetical protein
MAFPVGRLAAAAGLVALAIASPGAQIGEAGSTFRVFLSDGQALPSYGESAVVGDRVVFTLLLAGSAGPPELQLMSLPLPKVDLDRTRRYATTMRASHYASTRGEADYAALTAEVQGVLDQLIAIDDTRKRLDLAIDARRRLLAWSADHYHYRAADIQELAGLFDQVIAELRAAAGESRFDLELRAGAAAPPQEPLLPVPGVRESVALARAAAAAADITEERVGALRAAASLLGRETGADDLRAEVNRELAAEAAAEAAYAALAADLTAKADAALRRGDVAGVDGLRATLEARNRALGDRRPARVAALTAMLEAKAEAVRLHRKALDHYAAVRRNLLEYERRVRPVMSGFDGLESVLTYVRDGKYTAYERLVRTSERLEALAADLQGLEAPADLADLHATLVSAVHMAGEACTRRRLAVTTTSEATDREASAAAAGALLLSAHVRDQLVVRLFPPKIQ